MPWTYTSIASGGGEETFTKSLKPITNQRRKNASGTLIARTSNIAVGAMKGVAWFSSRRRNAQKKPMATTATAALASIVTVITK